MATEVLLIKDGGRLAAADPISQETLDGMRQGETVTATIRRPRNPRHHRLFFALLNIAYENQEKYPSLKTLLDAVKIGAGEYDLFTLPGKLPVQVCVPRSISFAKMDQAEFKLFYERAIDYIVTEIIPGMDRQLLRNEVTQNL